MRLLDRYLLRELLVPLGYCLSGFLLLWVTADLVNEFGSLQENKLSAGEIVAYYLVQAPGFLVLGMPIALLLALLYAMTNHARHHEITAIRAAGVSLWRLCLPYLAVGVLCSLAVLALNELWVPDSADRAERIKKHRGLRSDSQTLTNFCFNNSRDGRLWQIGVYDTKTGEMTRPVVVQKERDGSAVTLRADRAVRTNGVWTFFGHVQRYRDVTQNNSLPTRLPETQALVQPDFSETPEQIKSEIRISGIISTLAFRGVKRADIPLVEIVNYLRLHPHPDQAPLLFTKLHGRLAVPWTCVVVVLIAIPFGAASGRRNVFVGVASSLLIFFAYYVLQQLCLAIGAGGHAPAWLAGWFPNLAFGLAGLWLTTRVR
jgi:LPS export ABC transporter permease LptG